MTHENDIEENLDKSKRAITGIYHGAANSIFKSFSPGLDSLEEFRVRDYNPFFNHHFSHIPESEVLTKLWYYTDTQDGNLDRDGSELSLNTTATTNAYAEVETTEHGNYSPGSEAVCGMGVRVGSSPTGEQDAWWGYSNGTNGFGCGVDADGLYCFHDYGGTRDKYYQKDWNKDTLDGSDDDDNPSGLSLDNFQSGHIFRWPHLWYGYGQIEYVIAVRDRNGVEPVTVHSVNRDGDELFEQSNLPMKARVENNGTAESLSLYLNAVHYEKRTKDVDVRINGEYNNGVSVDDTWTPLISIRKRTDWADVNIKPLEVEISSDTDIVAEIQLDSDITGASFNLPEHTSSSETAVEVDTSATDFNTFGERRWVSRVKSGGNNKFGAAAAENIDFNIPAEQIITLAAKADSGQTGSVDAVLKWGEEF